VKRSRGGLVFKAHRLLYHSTLGLRVIKKKKRVENREEERPSRFSEARFSGSAPGDLARGGGFFFPVPA